MTIDPTRNIINCTGETLPIYRIDEEGRKIVDVSIPKTSYVAEVNFRSPFNEKSYDHSFKIGDRTKRIAIVDGKFYPLLVGFPKTPWVTVNEDPKHPPILVTAQVAIKLFELHQSCSNQGWNGDVFIPDYGDGAVKDDQGNVVGTTRLIHIIHQNTLRIGLAAKMTLSKR